jgi:hypothetical protein
MDERRGALRTRTLKSARISIDPRTSALDCIVRNLSSGGALLLVSSLAVPDRFDLIFTTSRARHACRVAWRGSDRVGVEFGNQFPGSAHPRESGDPGPKAGFPLARE